MPPPTNTRKPFSPLAPRTIFKPISWKAMAARSSAAPEMAILNLRGSQLNSGCSVDHWRKISHHGRGSSNSSLAAPANGSAVTLRTQLPLVWMQCISTSASAASTSGISTSFTQLN